MKQSVETGSLRFSGRRAKGNGRGGPVFMPIFSGKKGGLPLLKKDSPPGQLILNDFPQRGPPTQNRATVPGPLWAPMTGPISP